MLNNSTYTYRDSTKKHRQSYYMLVFEGRKDNRASLPSYSQWLLLFFSGVCCEPNQPVKVTTIQLTCVVLMYVLRVTNNKSEFFAAIY